MVYEETIRVVIQTMVEGMQKIPEYRDAFKEVGVTLNSMGRTIDSTSKQVVGNNEVMARLTKRYDGLTKSAFMSQEMFRLFQGRGVQMNTLGGKLGMTFRRMSTGMRGFRMELLGVMFFGQMLGQTLLQMFRPAANMMGIFELWTRVLQIFFLPILILLLPLLLSLMNWFMEMDPNIQLVIGGFILFLAIILKIIGIIGMLLLGLGSLSLFISGINFGPIIAGLKSFAASVGGVSSVVTTVSGIISAFLIVLAVLLVAVIGIAAAWKDNWSGIREWVQVLWEGIKNIFGGALKFIKGLWSAMISLFKGDTKAFKIAMILAWEGIKQFVSGVIQFLAGLLVTLGIGFLKFLDMVGRAMVNMGKVLLEMAFDLGKNFVEWLVSGIKSVGSAVYDALLDSFGWFRKLITGDGGGGGGGGGGTTARNVSDFMWRPGSAPVSFSPADTIIGTKGGLPAGIGGQPTIIFSPVYNINVHDKIAMERMIDANNKQMVEDLKRMIRA